jgi:hypothetical protein
MFLLIEVSATRRPAMADPAAKEFGDDFHDGISSR